MTISIVASSGEAPARVHAQANSRAILGATSLANLSQIPVLLT